MTDDLDARLESLGERPATPPDPHFADRLEARLLVQHDGLDAPPSAGRGRVAVVVAAAAAVLVGVLIAVRPAGDPSPLALASGSGSELVLPDGSVIDAEPGVTLPDGSTLIAGPDGASAGDVDLDPFETAVVDDGALVVEDDEPSPTSTTSTQPSDRPGTTSAPAPDRPPPSQLPPETAPTTTAPPSTTTTTTGDARPPIDKMTLHAERGPDRQVSLRWSGSRNDRFARYVVQRTVSTTDAPPPDPRWPDRGEVVFETTSNTTVSTTDEPPVRATRVAYRVYAFDRDGNIIGASQTVRP